MQCTIHNAWIEAILEVVLLLGLCFECYQCSQVLKVYLNLLVDVLQELNKLNNKFQFDTVDITTISTIIDTTISISSHHFLFEDGPLFGRTSINLEKILKEFAGNL